MAGPLINLTLRINLGWLQVTITLIIRRERRGSPGRVHPIVVAGLVGRLDDGSIVRHRTVTDASSESCPSFPVVTCGVVDCAPRRSDVSVVAETRHHVAGGHGVVVAGQHLAVHGAAHLAHTTTRRSCRLERCLTGSACSAPRARSPPGRTCR